MTRKLHRSRSQKIIGGVAGGIGEYFDIDPVFIRAAFILATFGWGSGIIAYIILWIIVPMRKLEPIGISPDGSPIGREVDELNIETEINIEKLERDTTKRNVVIGISFIVVGILIFLDNVLPDLYFDYWWPLLLVAFGGYLLYISILKSRGSNE